MSKKPSRPSGRKGKTSKAALIERYRERELNFERTHSGDLLKHAGRWIALEGESVIASSISLTQTIADARSRGISNPYVFFVSANDTAELGL